MMQKRNGNQNITSKIQFLQQNADKNGSKMHTCLQIGLELNIDFVLFQEPFVNTDSMTTISHSAYYCIMPESEKIRPRVMIFAKKNSRFQFCQRSDICSDTDILIIDINDSLNSNAEIIQLTNIYNEKSLSEGSNEWTVKRSLQNITPAKNSIVCGDFNAHHSWWNSAVPESDSRKAATLVKWLKNFNFDLQNEPDNGTFHKDNLIRASVIDLVFSTENISQYMSWWKDSEYTIGSQHDMIFFSLTRESDALVENPLYVCQYDYEKADWKNLNQDILAEQNNEEFRWTLTELSAESLEAEAEKLEKLITKLVEKHIPKKRLSERSKPWWSDKLKSLRKEMTKYRRRWRRYSDAQAQQEYHEARATFYYEMKKAKSKCWNNFLENASGKDIFKAFQYTKQNRVEKLPIIQYQSENREVNAVTFQEKCNAFLKTLFIKPPESTEPSWTDYQESEEWAWPEVTKDEIKAAIFTSSIKKAAGPDTISFLILQKIYAVLENRFYKLYKALIQFGYHPKCWKQAVGVILKKPNRKATIPKFYRVVSLLNCLGKVAEKIIAARLSYTAETSDLLYTDQIEGRRQKSAIDAVLSLVHDIQLAKHEKKAISVLFMNIKKAYDHVSANHLLKICQKLELSKKLCFWIRSFFQDRKVQLRFDENIQEMTDVNIEISQDSSVSPILFLIYIRYSLSDRSDDERIMSFVNDIGLIVSSKSIEKDSINKKSVHTN